MVTDDGWDRTIWDDRAISDWFERSFRKGRGDHVALRQVWKLLETSEMRAMIFKYLIILLEGGMVRRCRTNK
jgi:hypothetical protein